jgi:hypothetical protein
MPCSRYETKSKPFSRIKCKERAEGADSFSLRLSNEGGSGRTLIFLHTAEILLCLERRVVWKHTHISSTDLSLTPSRHAQLQSWRPERRGQYTQRHRSSYLSMSFRLSRPKKRKVNEHKDGEESYTSVLAKQIVVTSPLEKPHITVLGKVGCQTRAVSGDASTYSLTSFQVLAEKMKSLPS